MEVRALFAKAFGMLLAVAFTFVLPAGAQEVAKSTLDYIRQVSVSVEMPNGALGSGTTFMRDDETWCLTCSHVVKMDEGKPIRVTQYHSDKKPVSVYAELVYEDAKDDIAILKLGKGVFTKGCRFYEPKRPPLYSPVVHCGSMQGYHHSISRGYLVWHDRDVGPHGLMDQIDATLDFGSSGGGVFLTDGRFIGMVARGRVQRIALIVPYRTIKKHLDKVK